MNYLQEPDVTRCLTSVEDLLKFSVSPEFGFVLQKPLQQLPAYFESWERIANHLPCLIENETLRDEINKMPLLHHEKLHSHSELRLAHTYLTAMVHGYVWMKGENNITDRIPASLAIPVCGVSKRLGIDPAIRHYTFVLNNWRLIDINGKLELDNVETIVKLRGADDESWFFMVGLQMELDSAPGICSVVEAQQAVLRKDTTKVIDSLLQMSLSLTNIEMSLRRMHERNKPGIFYNVYRPFLTGWDSDAFKKKGLCGLIYEGVIPEPQIFVGGSGAQSGILFTFDAGLGIDKECSSSSVYNMFFNTLAPSHKDLIQSIRDGPSIKHYVVKECSDNQVLTDSYNSAVKALQNIRSFHIQLATRYIVIESHKQDTNKKFANQANSGTGGTEFMKVLKGLRNHTKDALVKQ